MSDHTFDTLREQLKQQIDVLAESDSLFAEAVSQYGIPEPRRREAGFSGLLRIILAQQISVSAANAIEGKLRERFPAFSAEEIAAASPDDLRSCGLSRPKISYAQGLAHAILDKRFDPEALASLADEAVIEKISALKGFGRWSAEIYCMFCLGRGDIFPADDRALQVAMQRLYALDYDMKAQEAREKAELWKPYRSAAATFLWHYYRGNPA